MKIRQFSVGEMVRYGFGKFRKRPAFFTLLSLTAFLITLIPIIFSLVIFFENLSEVLFWFFVLVSFFVFLLMKLGFKKVSLSFVNQEKPRISNLFTVWPHYSNYLVATLIYILATLVGLCFFIIPGIVIATRYSLYSFFILDQGNNCMDALSHSAKATEGAKWDLFSLGIITRIINLIGFVFFGVGLLVSVPTTSVAKAFMYKRLSD